MKPIRKLQYSHKPILKKYRSTYNVTLKSIPASNQY